MTIRIDSRKHHVARANVLPHELQDVDMVSDQNQRLIPLGFQRVSNERLQTGVSSRSQLGFVKK